MSKQTLNAETLVSEWNALPKDADWHQQVRQISRFEEPLESLLEAEIQGTITAEQKLVLEEYKKAFFFKTSFSIKSEFDINASYTHTIACSSYEDLQDKLEESKSDAFKKEASFDLRPTAIDCDVYEVGDFYPSVSVYSLQLKEQGEREEAIRNSLRINGLQDSFKDDLWELINSHSLDDDFKATILLDAEETLNKRAEEECA